MNKKRIILIAVAAVIIVGGGVWLFGSAKAKHKVTYATATINKGEISESLQAKYMAILNMQLLKFYQGEKIEL